MATCHIGVVVLVCVLSTNGIESINRSIKHYLGLGNCNQDRLDREMNLYHRQKVNAASAALNHGRMKKIRRETLAHQDSLFKSESEKTFLDSILDDIPPLEVIPESTELPSFLGTDFGARQSQKSGRITRSKSARFNPIL